MPELLCNCCGRPIDWPPLDYSAEPPLRELGVSQAEVKDRVKRNRDVCVIDAKTFLIRGNVEIPIIDGADSFAWGVWCSVTGRSFRRILDLWDSEDQSGERPFPAWLLTGLPCYDEPTSPIRARLRLRGPADVPLVEVTAAHALRREQRSGITMNRVWEFARTITGAASPPTRHGGCSPPG